MTDESARWRDTTVFPNDDGKACHVDVSEFNTSLQVSLVMDEFLKPGWTFDRRFNNTTNIFSYLDRWFQYRMNVTSASHGEGLQSVRVTR